MGLFKGKYDDYEIVGRFYDIGSAEMCRDILSDNGIESVIEVSKESAVIPLQPDFTGIFLVYVHKTLEEKALKILEEAEMSGPIENEENEKG